MRLRFKANVNDKYNPKLVYRKGETYDIDSKRAKELLKSLPRLIEAVDDVDTKESAEKPQEPSKTVQKADTASKTDDDKTKPTEESDAPADAEVSDSSADTASKE